MLTMPVATTRCSVAAISDSTNSRSPGGEAPTQTVPKPASSISCAISGLSSATTCQMP